jgi:hypothetical protein
MLGFGGLIASRTGHEPLDEPLRRWRVLRYLTPPVHAACVVMRTPDADDGGEEPDYYAHSGRALHAASRAMVAGTPAPAQLDPAVVDDFFGRRLRNHALNLAAVDLARGGAVDTLTVTADDTARGTLASAEQDWLRSWVRWLALGDRVLTHPGADEVGAVLTVRALGSLLGAPAATVRVHSAASLELVPPYENQPLGASIAQQVAAAGAVLASDEGAEPDLDLMVHAPTGDGFDHAVAPPTGTDDAAAAATAALVRDLLTAGRRVAVADCAHPNGADPALVAALRELVGTRWESLAAFAAWNTAGNTVGSALAHGLAVVIGRRAGSFDERAHAELVRHRLLEDWGWMSSTRARVRAAVGSDPARHDHLAPGSSERATAEGLAHRLLAERLAELDPAWALVRSAFPWDRTYEVDIEVAPR